MNSTEGRFQPSAQLDSDFARWLSEFASLLQKHGTEISRDPAGWRRYVLGKVGLALPRKRTGRVPNEKVTRAAELYAQDKTWQQIFVLTGTIEWAEQYRLREAVRARARRHGVAEQKKPLLCPHD